MIIHCQPRILSFSNCLRTRRSLARVERGRSGGDHPVKSEHFGWQGRRWPAVNQLIRPNVKLHRPRSHVYLSVRHTVRARNRVSSDYRTHYRYPPLTQLEPGITISACSTSGAPPDIAPPTEEPGRRIAAEHRGSLASDALTKGTVLVIHGIHGHGGS